MNTSSSLMPRDRHEAIRLLRPFFGVRADQVFEKHGCSLGRLLQAARLSTHWRMRALSAALGIAEAAAVEAAAERDALSSPGAVTQFLKLRFAGQPFESFVVLFLDAGNRLIAAEEMFRGTLTQTSVHPREVVKRALHHNAAAIICSHCHPSGLCESSRADELLTMTLRSALQLVDVCVLDHILVAGGGHMSFAQLGLL